MCQHETLEDLGSEKNGCVKFSIAPHQKNPMKLNRAILFSLLLHATLFSFLFWSLKTDRPPQPSSSPPIEVHLERGKKKGKGSTSSPPSSPQSPLSRPRKGRPKWNLGLPFDSGPRGTQEGKPQSGGVGSGSSEGSPDGYDLANRMGIETEGKLYPFFDSLWRKVDATVVYPNDFIQQRIRGKVTTQLGVDRRGVFTGEIRSVSGEEPMLNAFVLAALIHSLQEPLPENSWMQPQMGPEDQAHPSMLLVFRFEFELFGPGESPRKEEMPHLKNILSFKRHSYVDPLLNQTIEKIFTRYLPPIIPLPGGAFMDFPRAFIYFSNVLSPTPDEDELRARRLQLKREEWETWIRKKQSEARK